MKKLFTLVALLASFMGAKAEWVDVYTIDYSKYTGFPFYVMGYVPEWVDGVMTDYGSMYSYKTDADMEKEDALKEGDEEVGTVPTNDGTQYHKIHLASAGWHQYFIADGIKTELDGAYTVKALVKASEACTINVNMGWGWGDGQQTGCDVAIPASEDFVEVEWSYTGIGGSSCNLVAQPGTFAGTIEWKSLVVSQNQGEHRPVTWQEWLTSDGQPVIVETKVEDIPTWMGNAETPWADPNVKFNDQENNYLICAWGKEREVNMNDDGGWDPFPATIEQEENGNHYYIVHGKAATTEGDASAWDNQFWIQSPREWKSGTQLRISFRYKASKAVTVATQIHKQNPSDYLIWHAIGDINFTEDWQTFDDVMTMGDDMGGGWSIAFQLNQNDKDAIDFYFDDLSWQSMKLDEGLFVASSNTTTGLEYDFANATEFVYDEDNEAYLATVGTEGDQSSWVNQVMISTIRGNDAAFKGATIKPAGTVVSEEWLDYTEASLAKIKLPEAGVWNIYVDTVEKTMMFEKIEGEEPHEIIPINPNPTEIVINTVEREPTSSEQPADEEAGIAAGTGQPWDNQFWIVANRTLETGEVTIVQFKYRSKDDAKASTQLHSTPGNYLHWAAIGDVNFVGGEEWQDFEATLTVPSEGNGMQSIAFNLSEIKEANTYEIKDVVWKLEDGTESLINETGSENFFVKILGVNNNGPFQYGTDPGQPEEPIKGDANGDKVIDTADIVQIISVMAADGYTKAADTNGDGFIDTADIAQVISIMAAQARAAKAIEE